MMNGKQVLCVRRGYNIKAAKNQTAADVVENVI